MAVLKIRHLCAAVVLIAMTGFMLRHVYRHVSSLLNGAPPDNGRPPAVSVPFDMAVPENGEHALADPLAETENDASAFATVSGKNNATAAPSAKKPSPGRRAPSPAADLSRYRVKARRTASGDYLPGDDMTLAQVREDVNRNDNEEDWGKGVVGDVLRGAQKVVRRTDDATLDASRKALGTMASPDSAKIRPNADGVRLQINIPTP